jgi:hypothetical protein
VHIDQIDQDMQGAFNKLREKLKAFLARQVYFEAH